MREKEPCGCGFEFTRNSTYLVKCPQHAVDAWGLAFEASAIREDTPAERLLREMEAVQGVH